MKDKISNFFVFVIATTYLFIFKFFSKDFEAYLITLIFAGILQLIFSYLEKKSKIIKHAEKIYVFLCLTVFICLSFMLPFHKTKAITTDIISPALEIVCKAENTDASKITKYEKEKSVIYSFPVYSEFTCTFQNKNEKCAAIYDKCLSDFVAKKYIKNRMSFYDKSLMGFNTEGINKLESDNQSELYIGTTLSGTVVIFYREQNHVLVLMYSGDKEVSDILNIVEHQEI